MDRLGSTEIGIAGLKVTDFAPWITVTDSGARIEAPGVSILPPRGSDWIVGRAQKGRNVYVMFGKSVGTGRAITATLHSEATRIPWPSSRSPRSALEFLARRLLRSSSHDVVKDFTVSAPPAHGSTCLRFQATVEIRTVPSDPEPQSLLLTTGLTCFHPSAPRFIAITIGQQVPWGREAQSIDSEIAPLLESLEFTPVAISEVPVV